MRRLRQEPLECVSQWVRRHVEGGYVVISLGGNDAHAEVSECFTNTQASAQGSASGQGGLTTELQMGHPGYWLHVQGFTKHVERSKR